MRRTALVTGGCSGLGAACAERLEGDGLSVVRLDIQADADITADVSDGSAVAAALAHLDAIDVAVNCAGIVGPNAPLWELDPAAWQRTFAVNVNGTFNICQAAVPKMVATGWGRIVNFASMAGKDGNPRMSAYSASKAAIIGMTKSLGKELARTGVLVNAIAPAVFDTPMNATTSPEVLEHITRLIPMGRVGRPEEAAEMVSWLASDRCSFSTGAVFDLSGGRATY